MLQVKITNEETYPREVQYYGINKYIVLQPHTSVIIECKDSKEVIYYETLNTKKFKVVLEETVNQISEENKIESQESSEVFEVSSLLSNEQPNIEEEERNSEEGTDNCLLKPEAPISSSILLEELTAEELKKVIQHLGISTRVRSKDGLIELIKSTLPEESVDLSTICKGVL